MGVDNKYDEKKSLIFLIAFSSILYSCNKSNKLEVEYSNLINQKIISGLNNYSIYNYKGKLIPLENNFNLFDSLEKYEKTLIDKKLLKGVEKDNYFELIKSIEQVKYPNKFLTQIYESNPFIEHIMDGYSGGITITFHQCLRSLYEREGEIFRTNEYITSTDMIIANGYPNDEVLKRISETTDYSNKIQRLQLSYYILDNLDCRLNNLDSINDINSKNKIIL